jgi:hypothetical protein
VGGGQLDRRGSVGGGHPDRDGFSQPRWPPWPAGRGWDQPGLFHRLRRWTRRFQAEMASVAGWTWVGSAWAISSAAKMDEAISGGDGLRGRLDVGGISLGDFIGCEDRRGDFSGWSGQWAISSAAKMDEAIAAAVDFGILRGRWFHFRRRVVESGVCKCIL